MLDVYPARERAADFPGVSGLLVARGDGRRGRRAARLLAAATASGRLALLERLAGAATSCVVMGAGDVDALGRALVRGAGAMVEPAGDFPLARLTTVRTGGAAEHFARAGSRASCSSCSVGARARARGARARLGLEPARRRRRRARPGDQARARACADRAATATALRCGGGARLPSVAARAAELGLAGIEFGVNIPGTVGGAVRMNANAYDGALAEVLDWVEIVTAEGVARRGPEELGFAYRSSALRAGRSLRARASR